MEKRREEMTMAGLLSANERMVRQRFPKSVRTSLVHGAGEIDRVRSGLEEVVSRAYREIREVYKRRRRVDCLRTAAYALAIEKVARTYMELGIFP